MTQRDVVQQKYYHNLITNIKQKPKIGYTFDINLIDDIFTFQRVPFHSPSIMDHYQYIISEVIFDYIKRIQAPKTNKKLSKTQTKKNYENISAAITNLKYTLYSLTATHPQYGEVQIIALNDRNGKRKDGKIYTKWNIHLFNNNKTDKKLLCKIEIIHVILSLNKAKSVQQKRLKIKERMNKNNKDFKFIEDPCNVGQLSKSAVFLGNLQWNMDFDMIGLHIFANGLISINNGFDKHPWITGTGDHINSCHVLNCCMQFIYLLVKNCKKFKFMPSFVDEIFVNTIDPQCHITIYNADLQFIKFIELGLFVMKLNNLKMIKPNTDLLCKFKVRYEFEVELSLQQNKKECVIAKLCVCPIFLSSLL